MVSYNDQSQCRRASEILQFFHFHPMASSSESGVLRKGEVIAGSGAETASPEVFKLWKVRSRSQNQSNPPIVSLPQLH